MELKIVVTGIDTSECRQLVELLGDIEGVDNLHVSYGPHPTISVEVVAGVAWKAIVGDTATDAYKAAEEFLRERLEQWKRDALPNPERVRIEVKFGDDGEPMNRHIQ